jgi:hypothetical protein
MFNKKNDATKMVLSTSVIKYYRSDRGEPIVQDQSWRAHVRGIKTIHLVLCCIPVYGKHILRASNKLAYTNCRQMPLGDLGYIPNLTI